MIVHKNIMIHRKKLDIMGYIYKLTNTVNGKAYIGQTIQKPEKRIHKHLSLNHSGCPALHNAIQKYGRDAFTVEVLHETLDIFLDDLEVAEIKRHNSLAPNGYNLDGGGNKNKFVSDQTRKKLSEAGKGKTHTPETRKKLSEANKGKRRTHTPETRRKISEANKGRTLSPEARQKISNIKKGSTHSPETRRKISEGNKGKTISPETRRKMSEAAKGRTLSPEARQKISEGNKGKTISPETRRKISKAFKGRKCKPLSPEHRQKLSEAKYHPERAAAFEILNALPEGMPLKEKRKHLRDKFPEPGMTTLYRWVKQWSEPS